MMDDIKVKIENRLTEIYKQQAYLNDPNRVWVQPINSLSRTELIKINYALIDELEKLLK